MKSKSSLHHNRTSAASLRQPAQGALWVLPLRRFYTASKMLRMFADLGLTCIKEVWEFLLCNIIPEVGDRSCPRNWVL